MMYWTFTCSAYTLAVVKASQNGNGSVNQNKSRLIVMKRSSSKWVNLILLLLLLTHEEDFRKPNDLKNPAKMFPPEWGMLRALGCKANIQSSSRGLWSYLTSLKLCLRKKKKKKTYCLINCAGYFLLATRKWFCHQHTVSNSYQYSKFYPTKHKRMLINTRRDP